MQIDWLDQITQYIFEAVVRIFRSERDQYPAVGMFAFYGEIPDSTLSGWPEPYLVPAPRQEDLKRHGASQASN